ncbi:hypothetical protein N1851_034452 [Merluccius polli]|uniref:DDE Tnp4 domain-containing protein n=1 Tax=Merluccius polli TaxID=89951 RepID=A0AA47LZI6_MERPO|nr:hypothetical protein N1851_034452 [Merluccius polli]
MKTRFRAIFLQALEVHHTFVPQVITACAVLHNICLGVGDIMPPEDELQDAVPEDEGENGLEAVSGAPWRDRLSVEVSALEERTATATPAPPERPAEERGGSTATTTGSRLLLASPGSSLEQPRPASPLPGDQENKAPCSRRRWEGGIVHQCPGGGGDLFQAL